MSQLTPDQAALILNAVAIPSLQAEHPVTKSVIAAMPPDKIDYRPDPVTRSAVDLAWHIVTAENRFLEAVLAGAFDLTPRERPASIRTPDDINRWYADGFQKNVERLKGLPGDQLVRTIDFRGVFQFPAVL